MNRVCVRVLTCDFVYAEIGRRRGKKRREKKKKTIENTDNLLSDITHAILDNAV